MDKYIVAYEAIGDGTRDRGESQFLLCMKKDSLCKTTNLYKVLEKYSFTDIEKLDCYKSDVLQSGNVATGATAGFLAGGLAGAAIGAAVNSGAKPSWIVEITLHDSTKYFRLNNDTDKNAFVKWASKHNLL